MYCADAVVAARFVEVVEKLAEEVRNGNLLPGSKLPTHRALADRFGLAPATASRVYHELRKRGLTVGEVGRGTFVRGPGFQNMDDLNERGIASPLIDLSLNRLVLNSQSHLMKTALAEIVAEDTFSDLLGYQQPTGRLRDRLAACAWLDGRGLRVKPDQVLITLGAQHGIAVAVMALCQPGDAIVVETLTYPGFKILASLQNIPIIPAMMDSDGLDPFHLEEICKSRKIRAVYCMPTVHNPLGTVMPELRRQKIVDICRKHNVYIIEDDAYAFLEERKLPSLYSMAPDICFNIQSMAKVTASGLRIGYMVPPDSLYERSALAIRATTWTATPITAEIVSKWINNGIINCLIEEKRADAVKRQKVAAHILPSNAVQSHPASYNIWLTLPRNIRADDMLRHLQNQNVAASGSSAFTASKEVMPSALRLALGGTSYNNLIIGLHIVAKTYNSLL